MNYKHYKFIYIKSDFMIRLNFKQVNQNFTFSRIFDDGYDIVMDSE